MNHFARVTLVSFFFILVSCQTKKTPNEHVTINQQKYEIILSKYDNKKAQDRKNSFIDWEDRHQSQKTFNEQKKKGNFALITEVKKQHYKRRIYCKSKGPWVVRTGRKLNDFKNYHKDYISRGYLLLTLTCYTDEFNQKWYNATWVDHKKIDKFSKYLENYGITKAQLKKV